MKKKSRLVVGKQSAADRLKYDLPKPETDEQRLNREVRFSQNHSRALNRQIAAAQDQYFERLAAAVSPKGPPKDLRLAAMQKAYNAIKAKSRTPCPNNVTNAVRDAKVKISRQTVTDKWHLLKD